jgi:hypothetical protein
MRFLSLALILLYTILKLTRVIPVNILEKSRTLRPKVNTSLHTDLGAIAQQFVANN